MNTLSCVMLDENQPFVWTTDLNGIHFWRRWKIWGKKDPTYRDHRDWVAAAENLIRYCDSVRGAIPYEDRNFIVHSHGFQVWAYASALGLRTRRVISIAPPFRRDMEDTIRLARRNTERWCLVIDPNNDRVADLGSFGDGVIRRSRVFDVEGGRPDVIVRIPEIEHSRILNEKRSLWKENGLADFLR